MWRTLLMIPIFLNAGCYTPTPPLSILGSSTPIFIGLNSQAISVDADWTVFLSQLDLALARGINIVDITLANRTPSFITTLNSKLGARQVKILLRFDLDAADPTLSDSWLNTQKANVVQLILDVNQRMPGRVIGYRPTALDGGEWFLVSGSTPTLAARVAAVQIALAAQIKATAGSTMLVGFNMGYLYALAYLSGSTHINFNTVLASPNIDYIVGPYDYGYARPVNAPFLPQGPMEAAALHGKLYIVEDDTRTSLADSDPWKYSTGTADDVSLVTRNIHSAIQHKSGLYLFDLQNKGWFNSSAIWDAVVTAKAYTPTYSSTIVMIDDTTLPNQTPPYGSVPLSVFNQGSNVVYGIKSDVNSGLLDLSLYSSIVNLN